MTKDLVSNFVKEAPPYSFGLDAGKKAFREGVSEIICELDKNENPFGVSPKAVEAMKTACESANRYPDILATSLREKLAALHGLSTDNIMVTQGATANLGFIAEMFIKENDEVIVPVPTYPNYYNLVKKNDGILVKVPTGEGFEIDFDKMYEAITDKTKLVFIANPNNPTGTLCDDDKLLDFINKLPSHVVIVVDEAYFDFVEDPNYKSMIPYIKDGLNLIVVKTFSKLYGMAGSRIGYVMSNKEIIDYLQIDGIGYCCNIVGLAGAEAAVDDREFVEMTISKNKEGRDYLTTEMTKLGFTVYPSNTNFIYFKPTLSPKELADELYTFGIMIRGETDCNRISVGTMDENRMAIAAMKQILLEER